MILIELFYSFLTIGVLAFGGGYAIMPLLEQQLVTAHGWLTVDEFADVVTIAEMTPGPTALDAASFVGCRLAGIPGAIVATVGFILPSCIIVTVLALLYKKYSSLHYVSGALRGLRPAVVGMIAAAAVTMSALTFLSSPVAGALLPTPFGGVNFISAALFIISFAAVRAAKWSPILVMSLSGVMGLLAYAAMG